MSSADNLRLHAQGNKQRHPFAHHIAAEPSGRDADNCDGIPVQPNIFTDDRGRERELSLPIFITQHDYGIGAFSRIVSIGEQTPSGGLEAEHGEIISAHHASRNFFVRKLTLAGLHFKVMVRGSGA